MQQCGRKMACECGNADGKWHVKAAMRTETARECSNAEMETAYECGNVEGKWHVNAAMQMENST